MNQNREMGSRHSKRPCKLCIDKNAQVDYKDIANLKRFISEDGKILPRHLTGNCAEHQRQVTLAIKRCREIAL